MGSSHIRFSNIAIDSRIDSTSRLLERSTDSSLLIFETVVGSPTTNLLSFTRNLINREVRFHALSKRVPLKELSLHQSIGGFCHLNVP